MKKLYIPLEISVSEETIKNLSLAAKDRILREADKKKISLSRLGSKMSLETRGKISASVSAFRGISVTVKDTKNNTEIKYPTLSYRCIKNCCKKSSRIKKYVKKHTTFLRINKVNSLFITILSLNG